MERDQTIITAKDLKIALRRAKGNSKELIEAEIDHGNGSGDFIRMPERRSR